MSDQGHSETVVIRQYARGRLYDRAAGAYVSLEQLVGMARAGVDVVILDAGTGADVTARVLTQ